MRALLKLISILLGTLLLIVIASMLIIATLINPNNFKSQICKQVYAQTGRNLSIGNMSWTFFPWLGIKASNISLSNGAEFNALPFMEAKSVDINARLLPLLHGHIQVGHLTLDGVSLNLITDNQGMSNWQDLTYVTTGSQTLPTSSNNQANATHRVPNNNISSSDDANSSENTNNKMKSNASTTSQLSFGISNITITNANIYWVYAPKNQLLTIQINKLKSENIGFDHAFPLTLDVAINSNQSSLSGVYSLDADILINRQQQALTLQNLDVKAQRINKKYPSGSLNVSMAADIATIINHPFTLSIPHFTADIANMHLQGRLQNNTRNDFKGTVQIADFNPKQFLVAVGESAPNTQDSSVLKHLNATCLFELKDNSLSIQQLQAQLDDSTINGNIVVTHFANPQINLNFAVNKINLDRYSSAASGSTATVNANNQSRLPASINTAQSGLLPIDTLRKLNVKGHVLIGELNIAKFDITRFDTQFNAAQGLIVFNPLRGQMYQGQTNSKIKIDVRHTVPQIAINTHLSNMNIEPVLSNLVKITRIQVSGIGNLSANLIASGNDTSSIKRSLNGNATFSISNGVLKGIDILYYYDVADALIHKQAPTVTNTQQTAFGNLTGTATINNGLVSNNDLSIHAPGLAVTGKGTADLVGEKLNYAMMMQRMKEDANLKAQGPAIPLKISGSFDHPSIQPDILSIAQSALEKQVEKQVQKILPPGVSQQLQNAISNGDVGKQLQQGLKSLLGQ